MLKNLRWHLSGLYVLAAATLILLIGGGAYGLLSYYFQSATDLALQYKVALEYTRTGRPVPPDLQAVAQAWQTSHPVPTPTRAPALSGDEHGESDEESEHPAPPPGETTAPPPGETTAPPLGETTEEYYDSELASIFLLPINAQGQVITNPNAYSLSFQPDEQAIQSALAAGKDFRTVRQPDGSRMRLFTYRVAVGNELAVLQVGRSLKDQDHALAQLLMGLIVLGSLSVLLVGIGSWWLAGRSVIPAQQAWDRQQAFIANASHELRTPLTLLRASAEVAQRGLDPQDPRAELLGDILSETDHMSQLVNDLLLLSRMDAARLQLDHQPIDLAALLRTLEREMGRVAAAREVTLEVRRAQGIAHADPTRVRQVLLILLDNALRHTPPGGYIRMAARAAGRAVEIRVSDTGHGIPAQHLPHIFERFYRGETDRRQSAHGSGLGLAIARGLVEAMQGQIRIDSRPGEGTTVTIRLPGAST